MLIAALMSRFHVLRIQSLLLQRFTLKHVSSISEKQQLHFADVLNSLMNTSVVSRHNFRVKDFVIVGGTPLIVPCISPSPCAMTIFDWDSLFVVPVILETAVSMAFFFL